MKYKVRSQAICYLCDVAPKFGQGGTIKGIFNRTSGEYETGSEWFNTEGGIRDLGQMIEVDTPQEPEPAEILELSI
jgi:hypothetical protein